MKQIVCDFCDAVKLGYKQFQKEFNSVRQARLIAKGIRGVGSAQACDYDSMQKIKNIREEASSLYQGEHIEPTYYNYYNPVDGVQKAFREMDK